MTQLLQVSHCLASLALFKELYDNRLSIVDVISEFILDTVHSNNMRTFTLNDVTETMNNANDFDIPQTVVKASLKKISSIKSVSGVYTFLSDDKLEQDMHIMERKQSLQSTYKDIITLCAEYIADSKKTDIDNINKSTVGQTLYSVLLGDYYPTEYTELLSAYIIHQQNNADFVIKLNNIKEALILHTGIKYCTDLSHIGVWTTNIAFFLDTEVLFYAAGYSGNVFKNMFSDLYKLVKDINTKRAKANKGPLIVLKYFQEAKNEVDAFFRKAESIVNGSEVLDPSKTAMVYITQICKKASDVIQMRAAFYKLLDDLSIVQDTYTGYYSAENEKYNVINQSILEKYSTTITQHKVDIALKQINHINVLRKGDSKKSFDNIGYVLITGDHSTLFISRDGEIQDRELVPLATTMEFITNKLWFKLNKGFGTESHPTSFSVVVQSQIILSTMLGKSISAKFDELKKDYVSGKIGADDSIATLIELRERMKKPEDINESEVDEVLYTISEKSLAIHQEELSILRKQIDAKDQQISLMQEQSEASVAREEKLREDFEKAVRKKNEEIEGLISSHNDEIDKISQELSKVNARLDSINKDSIKAIEERKHRRLRIVFLIMSAVFLFELIAMCFLDLPKWLSVLKTVVLIIVGVAGFVITILSFFGIDFIGIAKWWTQYSNKEQRAD